MRSAELMCRSVGPSERDGDIKLPTGHREHVRSVVYDLIECHQRKAERHKLNDWPQTDHCCADSQTRKAILADRRIYNPSRAKALKQTVADLVSALVFRY